MKRVNKILENSTYQEYIRKNKAAEVDRIFCCHNMEHFLDVARIAQMMNLEEGLGLSKELIYATALLHDIGRHVQYADGTPHEVASVKLAEDILEECGFGKKAKAEILRAILEHRNKKIAKEKSLAGVIYRADKASRACFACDAEELCNWKKAKKNLKIVY